MQLKIKSPLTIEKNIKGNKTIKNDNTIQNSSIQLKSSNFIAIPSLQRKKNKGIIQRKSYNEWISDIGHGTEVSKGDTPYDYKINLGDNLFNRKAYFSQATEKGANLGASVNEICDTIITNRQAFIGKIKSTNQTQLTKEEKEAKKIYKAGDIKTTNKKDNKEPSNDSIFSNKDRNSCFGEHEQDCLREFYLKPFTCKIEGKYKIDSENEKGHVWDVYAFSKDKWGYLVNVYDKDKNTPAYEGYLENTNIPRKGEPIKEMHDSKGENSIYSNIDSLRTEIWNKSSSIGDEHGKLLGEGARFNCVRRNLFKIQDNSFIYYSEKSNLHKGIYFNTLWKNWKKWFNKKYKIKDVDIIKIIFRCYPSRAAQSSTGEVISQETVNDKTDILLDPNK